MQAYQYPRTHPGDTAEESGVLPLPRPAAATTRGAHLAVQALEADVARHSAWVQPLLQEVGKVVVGQKALIDRLLVGLLVNGHILLEGVPGLAKTLAVKTLAGTIDAGFQRLQFTPDMLPADIVGTLIYRPRGGGFVTKRGPVFTNLVLEDELLLGRSAREDIILDESVRILAEYAELVRRSGERR
jgi:MoxR-like ATPase